MADPDSSHQHDSPRHEAYRRGYAPALAQLEGITRPRGGQPPQVVGLGGNVFGLQVTLPGALLVVTDAAGSLRPGSYRTGWTVGLYLDSPSTPGQPGSSVASVSTGRAGVDLEEEGCLFLHSLHDPGPAALQQLTAAALTVHDDHCMGDSR